MMTKNHKFTLPDLRLLAFALLVFTLFFALLFGVLSIIELWDLQAAG